MTVLTTWQVYAIGVIGGLSAVAGLILFALLLLALYALIARAHDALANRRTLRKGRRQLAAITSPDDLKDRP